MLTSLLIASLCCWRVTHLLNAEDGPGDVLVRLRRLCGDSFLGKLLDCFYCLSIWTAAPLAYLVSSSWKQGFLMWMSISGAACLLERATSQTPAAGYYELPKERP